MRDLEILSRLDDECADDRIARADLSIRYAGSHRPGVGVRIDLDAEEPEPGAARGTNGGRMLAHAPGEGTATGDLPLDLVRERTERRRHQPGQRDQSGPRQDPSCNSSMSHYCSLAVLGLDNTKIQLAVTLSPVARLHFQVCAGWTTKADAAPSAAARAFVGLQGEDAQCRD